MASDRSAYIAEAPSVTLDHLIGFEGPADAFLLQLLASQCEMARATSGSLIRYVGGEQPAEVIALYPPAEKEDDAPGWIGLAVQAMGQAAQTKGSMVLGLQRQDALYADSEQDHLIILPLKNKQAFTGVAAFHLPPGTEIERSRDRLEVTAALINVFELRQALEKRGSDLKLMTEAMRIMAAVNDQEKFRAASLALVNEIAAKYKAERVSIGMLEGRYVKVQAISQTEHFTRKMKLVQDIESAMEECLDQDVELVHPCPPEQPAITRQTKKLAEQHGPTTIISLPLRVGGESPEAIGIIVIEKPMDEPPTLREAETLRIASDLVAARLKELYERDKWIGAQVAKTSRKGLAWLIGSKHTWLKLTALAIFAILAVLILVPGMDKVSAPFTVEATSRTILPAPFDGHLETLNVEPNAEVLGGQTILAGLRKTELSEQLLEEMAEKARHEADLDKAIEEGKLGDQRAASARINASMARIRQLNLKLKEADIRSPISGVVIEGDLRKRVGGTVQRGEELFQVASLEDLRGELMVSESRIGDVEVGYIGKLATSDRPERKIAFTVLSIDPVAEPQEGKNVFRVRVAFDEEDVAELTAGKQSLLIGQEGVAKIHIKERPLIVVWTRDLVNWVRMKLWI